MKENYKVENSRLQELDETDENSECQENTIPFQAAEQIGRRASTLRFFALCDEKLTLIVYNMVGFCQDPEN